MTIEPVMLRMDSKAEQLADHFQRLIIEGTLNPGEHLGTKQDLIRRHGIAAGTMNEALRLLASRGYVELRSGPRGGAFVSEQAKQVRLRHSLIEAIGDPREMADIIQVRDQLEVLVAVEAARACTAQDSPRILAAEAAAATASPGTPRLIKIWELHREIAVTGRNRILSSFYANLLDALVQNIGAVEVSRTVLPGVSGDTAKVHRNLVQAVIDNDVPAAARAARAHTPLGEASHVH